MQSSRKHPVFMNKMEILKSLGEGNTSKVYLARNIKDGTFCALKILKEEFLRKDADSILAVQNEIMILKSLNHPRIIRMQEYGDKGQVVKSSGKVLSNLVYISMDYIQNGLLFDLCQKLGAMGENAGRFFLA